MSHSSTPAVTSSSTVPESTYPSLVLPTFKSQIPDYLLKDASAPEQYIMEQLSVLMQNSQWSNQAHISTMESVRKTNGRLIRAEAIIADMQEEKQVKQEGAKLVLKGWKLLVAVTSVIGGAIWFLIKAYALVVHGVS